MDKTGEDINGLHQGKFEKFERNLRYHGQFIHVSKCHLLSWKIILSCYVAMILQMKDSWSANLTFRAHNKQNYTQLPKIS